MENQIQQPQVLNPTPDPLQTPPKAGFILRWAAYTLDSLIVGIGVGVLSIITNIILKADTNINEFGGLILLIYFVITTGLYGASLGKKYFRLAIVNEIGNKPGWGKAILRELLGKFLSSLIFGLGFASALWNKNKQTWHDKLAGTYVIQTEQIGKGKKLIAYLIVVIFPIAIVGIIAALVLVAINPMAQVKKAQEARDRQNQILQQYKDPAGSPSTY